MDAPSRDRYKWIALSNTTLGVFMASLDSSIVLISLTANSAAIITDAFPATQRGFAIGVSVIAGIAGAFIGLVVGGVLADVDWRAVFWINVPIGVFGTVWAYAKLREVGTTQRAKIDWWGNLTFG